MIRFFTTTLTITLFLACNQQPSPAPGPVIAAPPSSIRILDANEFEAQVKATLNYLLLDLRLTEDFERGRLYRAVSMPCPNAGCEAAWQNLGHDSRIFLYCSNGYVSTQTAQKMEQAGFADIWVLKGGLISWASAGKMMTRL